MKIFVEVKIWLAAETYVLIKTGPMPNDLRHTYLSHIYISHLDLSRV
jgi:hypothetical protein